jgi:hypothetical protein
MLRDIAERGGIKKDVNPHSFRHARATCLSKGMKEHELDLYFGWTQGSQIPARYIHLSGRDLDDAVLKSRGIKPKEEPTENTLAPKPCSRCKLINKATSKFCGQCGAALDLKTALEAESSIDEVLKKLLLNPEVQKALGAETKHVKITIKI